jgi:hypothetical protein
MAYRNLLETLAYLASVKAQEKYIIGGSDEYVVPDELLEDFLSKVDFFKFEKFPDRIDWLKSRTGDTAFQAIEELYSDIKAAGSFLQEYTHANIAELIKADPVWLRIRDASLTILNLCDFDLEAWEKENA